MFIKEERLIEGFDFGRTKTSLCEKETVNMLQRIMFLNSNFAKNIKKVFCSFDVKNISPIEMYKLSNLLHNMKLLSNHEYLYLSFQPEMHPNFNETIGFYVGVKAEPEKSRNYLKFWEEKLMKENKTGSLSARKTKRIVRILKNFEKISSIAKYCYEKENLKTG